MKVLSPFIVIICALALHIHNKRPKFETVIEFQQIYSDGLVDTAVAVIKTRDSLRYIYLYDKPTRCYPTGGWYFAEKYGMAESDRHYIHPQVVKIRPFRVTSKRWK